MVAWGCFRLMLTRVGMNIMPHFYNLASCSPAAKSYFDI